ncbi:MAG TPA: hypothetical protein DCM87_08215 [Planctomycetes bacterium]|nr:hypothetical protein [Planctomycetota bacterium]
MSWPDLGGFMYVLTDNEINERLIAIGNALQDLAFVEYVEITPVCDILPGDIGEDTPDLEQYLWASPSMFDPDPGMWFNALRAYFGTVYLFEGKGRGVDVYDVECAWRTSHEDLQALTWTTESGQIPHSSVLQNVDFIDHGTAVLGIIAADEDLEWATGLRGLASEVDAHLYPTFRGSRT